MSLLKLKLKRVDPVKYATIASLLTALLMLIFFVPFFLVISAVGAGMSEDAMGPAAMIFGGGVFMIILVPILYGAFTFIVTLILTFLLNFILKKTGGLDLDFEKVGLDVGRTEA